MANREVKDQDKFSPRKIISPLENYFVRGLKLYSLYPPTKHHHNTVEEEEEMVGSSIEGKKDTEIHNEM